MMIRSLFGPDTTAAMLRGGLEETSATQRGIAARVAAVTTSSANGDFASQLNAKTGAGATRPSEADLQQEMAALADTELRYETCAKLLQGEYAGIKSAIQTTSA